MCIAANAQSSPKTISYKKYNRQLRKTERILIKQLKQMPGFGQLDGEDENENTPDAYWLQQYLSTINPALGRPTPEVLIPILQKLYSPGLANRAAAGKSVTPWVERGPNNVGGRTRSLAWDPSDVTGKKVWAGSVGGGLWVNNDITSSTGKWIPVNSLWSNLSVTAIAFGSLGKDTMYVGTGEGFGASSSMTRGYGIWKSVDGGKNFSLLSNTTGFYFCNDIVVRTENNKSVVYASIVANYYGGTYHGSGAGAFGMFRSTNGGSTWTNVSPSAANSGKFSYADIEIDANNRLWAGTMKNPNGGADAGGGRIMYSDNGTTWTTAFTSRDKNGRVEIACAPGKASTLYAIFESGGKLDSVVVSKNNGASFTAKSEPVDLDNGIPDSDFTRGQAWYDLIMAVDPNDSNTLIIGGVDLFRSTNGATSWTHISKWSNNNNLGSLGCSYVHADQHAIVYKPGSSSTVIFGNDGGVFYTNSVSTASSSAVIPARNNGYNVTQFYWGDLSSTGGSNVMIAGAQDNGTQRYTAAGMNSTTEVTGGDGAYCFISPSSSSKQISSYVYNTYYYTTNSWSSNGTLINRSSLGRFINPAEWDENGPGLITYRSTGKAFRIKLTTSPGALDSFTYNFSGSDLGSALYAHKTRSGKSRLWIGTDAGGIRMTLDAWATTPSFSSRGTGVNAGNISSFNTIRFGDTMAVVLSNYGIKNIYTSFDSGATWTSRDGNLPDMPVWSIVLNPNKIGEAIIATDIGIYGTANVFATSPTWTADTAGIGPVKVNTLRYRKADQMLMAVTHGRGVFTNDAWSKNNPIAQFGASSKDVCTNTVVNLLDSSLNDPTTWAWAITPRNMVYLGGTDSTSQNPKVRFTQGITYNVKLTVGNALGSNAITKNTYITVTDTVVGTASLILSRASLCAGDTLVLNANVPATLSSSITSWAWFKNATNIGSTANSLTVNPLAGDSFRLALTSNKKCVSPASFSTNRVFPVVNSIVNASAKISAMAGCAGKPLTVSVAGTNTGASPAWSWFLNGTSIAGTASSVAIPLPLNGDKVWAKITVAGPCVKPANTIFSDTSTLVINPKPSTPSVSRNYDTLFSSNVGAGTYTWYRNGVVKGTGRQLKTNQNGTFKCVYAELGCNSDSSSAIIFNSLGTNGFGDFQMLYPNPATDVLFVPSYSACGDIKIFNAAGAQVEFFGVFLKPQNGTSALGIKDLKPGAYLLTIQAKDCGNAVNYRYRFIKINP